MTQFDLAIAATVKDEATYIEEWIAFHTVVGVQHFFIYDNSSTDDLVGVLTPYVNHGLVTLVSWPLDRGQASAYKHAVHFFGGSTRWLAIIDVDEFIVPRLDDDVPTLLERIDPEQMVMPWRMFGFGGHRTRPPGLVMENFTVAQDLPEGGLGHIAAKAIVKPGALTGVAIHLHRTKSKRYFDAGGSPVVTDSVRVMNPDYGALQLNHYYTKSEQEFAAKVERGPGSGSPQKRLFGIADEIGYNSVDTAIERFVEPTRQRMLDLAALARQPFRYGSQLSIASLRHDPFKSHAQRAIANSLHRVVAPTNASPAVDDLGDRWRSSVVAIEDHCGLDSHFLASVHVDDFVRRLGAVWIWRSDQAGNGPADCLTDLATPDPTARRHVAVVAVLQTTAPSSVDWSMVGPERGQTASLELASASWHVAIIQITTAPVRATAVKTVVDAPAACTLHEIGFLSYG